MSVGIGVVTYNRVNRLTECIGWLRSMTSEPYDLVIADDGSTDNTLEFLYKEKIPTITGENRGIAWNKNRALFTLLERNHDVIILLEDDSFTDSSDWLPFWVELVRQWGHVNYAGLWWPKGAFLRGEGTIDNPYFCNSVTAQISGFRRDVLDAVGFYDTRFRRFGHEHTEHTTRIIRAGFGGCQRGTGAHRGYDFICANHGIKCNADASYHDEVALAANGELRAQMIHEPLYRDPWRTDYERKCLLSEFANITKYVL